MESSLGDSKKKLGQNHVDKTTTLIDITSVLVYEVKHEVTMKKYQEVIPTFEKGYGSDSVEITSLLITYE